MEESIGTNFAFSILKPLKNVIKEHGTNATTISIHIQNHIKNPCLGIQAEMSILG